MSSTSVNTQMGSEMMIKFGPYPALLHEGARRHYGKPWDDKGQSLLCRIFISHDDTCIKSLQTVSILNGKTQLSDKHGADGRCFKNIEIDYPSEFLTGINGFYIQDYDWEKNSYIYQIKSLTFETNKRKTGPIGQEEGTRFYIEMGTNQNFFGGFHGTSDSTRLMSIGVHFKPIDPSDETKLQTPTVKRLKRGGGKIVEKNIIIEH